jgi:hypothetical protein
MKNRPPWSSWASRSSISALFTIFCFAIALPPTPPTAHPTQLQFFRWKIVGFCFWRKNLQIIVHVFVVGTKVDITVVVDENFVRIQQKKKHAFPAVISPSNHRRRLQTTDTIVKLGSAFLLFLPRRRQERADNDTNAFAITPTDDDTTPVCI